MPKEKDKSMAHKPQYDKKFKKNTIEQLIKSRKSYSSL
ncbi:hypothetical protein LEP1GSC096_0770 [Leptospira interrogans serovar Hebdomadis str. R499]|nr:hypothetical protein LEP1GSC045_1200 [Leptospira interrogans serovar Pomona str. Kennewicki LC82-25]EKN96046.1 hypothetical protein LEP1GSC014_4278 [Leptospira interrogans serovar Pomona str. Pomona]EKR25318.1 hypothetical protein LEP1GSC087_0725 [Leptospira interrogans serovar Bataviae str. L1111]EKR38039.1 hypothetical protein LEP1GSC096_0770 [Leptospira interrogans serovar Hebdomadis str. R499]EKR80620.1 hypothetical protein LEP1GSC099_2264 [Leptospira interrogans str. UI 08452]EMF35282.